MINKIEEKTIINWETRKEIAEYIIKLIEENNQYLILDRSGKSIVYIRFISQKLDGVIGKDGNRWSTAERLLLFEFNNREEYLDLKLIIGPGSQESRKFLFDLTEGENIFNYRHNSLSEKYNTIYRKRLLHYINELDISKFQLLETLKNRFEDFCSNDLVEIEDFFCDSQDVSNYYGITRENSSSEKEIITATETQKTENITTNRLKPRTELETYKPKKNVDIDDTKKSSNETYKSKIVFDVDKLKEISSEIDYIERHQKQMEIGDQAEKIVLESEIEFLRTENPKLAAKVQLVSVYPQLGFDILSYETNGDQKQIEVKAISVKGNAKSFIITSNEYSKSKVYSNYHIYCVTEMNSGKPKILRIKNPDFDSKDDFLIKPLTYNITFE